MSLVLYLKLRTAILETFTHSAVIVLVCHRAEMRYPFKIASMSSRDAPPQVEMHLLEGPDEEPSRWKSMKRKEKKIVHHTEGFEFLTF